MTKIFKNKFKNQNLRLKEMKSHLKEEIAILVLRDNNLRFDLSNLIYLIAFDEILLI
jgi:hypothetical protein